MFNTDKIFQGIAYELKPNTTYHFAVFTYNSVDKCYNLNKATAFETTDSGYPGFELNDGTFLFSKVFDFGTIGVNTYIDTVIYIKNIAQGNLKIFGVNITKQNNNSFQIISAPTFPLLLAEDERIPITIRCYPLTIGNTSTFLNLFFSNTYEIISLKLNASALFLPLHYRSINDGIWENPLTWESSVDNINWKQAVRPPSDIDGAVLIDHYITIYDPVAIKNAVITENGFLDVFKGPLSIINVQSDDMTVYGILKTSFDGDITTNGNILFKKGSNYIHNVNHKASIPNGTWEIGSTCEINGYTSTPDLSKIGLNQSFFNLIWNCPYQKNDANLAGLLNTVNGDFIIENTGLSLIKLSETTANLNIRGDLIIGANAMLDLGGETQSASIQIGGDLYIAGSIVNSGTAGAQITFNGQKQTFYTHNSNALNNNIDFVIDNKTTVTLNSNISIPKNLILKNGKLALDAYDMCIVGNIIGGNKASYIQTNGIGKLILDVHGSMHFPIGNTSYNPVTLTTKVPNSLGARVIDAVYTNGHIGKIINQDVVKRTWDISGNLIDTLSLELFWSENDEGLRFDRDKCYISHYENSKWNGEAPDAASNDIMISRSRDGFTTLSPFAIGSNGVMPVTYNLFSARPYKDDVKLAFATLLEEKNEFFEIERSADGEIFESIGKIDGAGDSYQELRYTFIDSEPLEDLNYYRIRQVSSDGYETFTDTRLVKYSTYTITVNLRNRDGQIDIFTDVNNYNVRIFNMAGQEVAYFPQLYGTQSIGIGSIESGLYFAKVEFPESGYFEVIKILKY